MYSLSDGGCDPFSRHQKRRQRCCYLFCHVAGGMADCAIGGCYHADLHQGLGQAVNDVGQGDAVRPRGKGQGHAMAQDWLRKRQNVIYRR